MPSLLYIHGFLSSPLSNKAQQVKNWLAVKHPEIDYHCPQLTPYPNQCVDTLNFLCETLEQPVGIMGSSMGGFWATLLVEKYDCKAVLINPAVDVLNLMPKYLDQCLQNYHYQETYVLNKQHLQDLQQYIIQTVKPEKYWVLLQTGDEVLDYQLAASKYKACRQTIEVGGDHSFQGFERYIGPSIEFLFETCT